jgi:uncharacterized protein (TIGR03663 family)
VAPPEPDVPEIEAPSAPDRLWLGVALITAVGFAFRMWDLGSRAMHHDESLHALYSWYLYVGRPYVHDPMMHGPFLFHLTALLYFLFGDSEVTFRLGFVLLGTASIALTYFLRHELGRAGTIAAALMLAFGPVFLYFSRFGHNEALLLFQELLMVVGLFGWVRTRKPAYLYAAAIGLGLMFSTKMTWAIFGFIIAVFVAASMALEMRRPLGSRPITEAVRDVGFKRLGICAGIVLGIAFVLYTTFFTNLDGICTALWAPNFGSCAGKKGMLQYWIEQQPVARGSQPVFYYFLLLPLYAIVPAVLAIAAPFLAKRPRSTFFSFSCWWAIASLLLYSYASEKMPWLVVHLATPLAILGALTIDGIAVHFKRPWGLTPRQWAVAGLGVLTVAAFIAWASLGVPPGATPAVENATRLRKIALGLVVTGLAVGALWTALALSARRAVAAIGAVGLGVLIIYSVHTSLQVVYKNGDVPGEMLVYVQSSPDVVFISNEVERISNQLGLRKDMPLLLDGGYVDNVGGQQVDHEAVSWPFEWYFRDYRAKTYFSRTLPADFSSNKYPLILVMGTTIDPIRDQLGGYTGNKFRLNWWYPEDYKQLNLETISTIPQTLLDPEGRLKLMKYIFYRELMNPPLGARDLYLYVRNDLVGSGSPVVSDRAGTTSVSGSVPTTSGPSLSVAQLYGRSAGQQVLREPKGVAVGPDGRIYVTDVGSSTISILNRDGSVAKVWGTKGSGDGQMNEPWGIAVGPDGSVYVADTWNHRVQKFDSEGNFIMKWGTGEMGTENGRFYGPRDVAVSPSGQVLVTDTGNKRIQVFDQNGVFQRSFGTEGTGAGQFQEPVGITVDAQGKIYVADTWNERIQVFDSAFQSLGQYNVTGWSSKTLTNKPYIAVGPDGTVYATRPDLKQVLSVKNGLVTTLSLPNSPALAMPSGIEVDSAGRLLVTDTASNTMVAYELPTDSGMQLVPSAPAGAVGDEAPDMGAQ